MKLFELKLTVIAPLVVMCCLIGLGSQVAQAQSPQTFQTGDVFVAIAGLSSTGKVLWYRNGALVGTLDTGQPNTYTAGMAFDASGNLYATVFGDQNVVKFNSSGTLQGTFGSGYNADPESILFDSAGNAYVGQADGTRQVLKFSSGGAPLATFAPATEGRGTDWIELAGDQRTLYYTSEGNHVKRFDLSTNTQLADFNVVPLLGSFAYALRILPNGQVLVADSDRVVLLDTAGNVVKTYLASSLEPSNPGPQLFALTLDPDGKSFWTADLNTGTVLKVDIATGVVDPPTPINTGSTVGGLLVFGEATQSQQSVSIHLGPSSPGGTSSATAPFLQNGDPNDPGSHAMKITTNVKNPNGIDLVVSAKYYPTEFTGHPNGSSNAVGLVDGICEVSQLGGIIDETKDPVDCQLAKGGFVYQKLSNGDLVVPHATPYHDAMATVYRISSTAKAQDEVPPGSPVCGTGVPPAGPPCYDYISPVLEEMGWNTNLVLAPSTTEHAEGWNNQIERLYDRHGDDPDPAFRFDITNYFNVNCNLSCSHLLPPDQSGGGTTKHFNDFVWADVPNPPAGTPPDEVTLLVPVPGISPFTYIAGLPMLVAFRLENEKLEKSDPTALTPPHSVSVYTLDPTGNPIQPQFPAGAATTFTYNSFYQAYFILLSPAPYKLSDGTPNTLYTLQIGSDLFPPVSATFKVCTLAQVWSNTCL